MRLGRPKTLVLVFAAGLLTVVAVLMLADLEWRRSQALQSGASRATNRAEITAEYMRQRFALVDTSLRQLVLHGQRVGGLSPSDEWSDILNATRASLPGSGSVSVTDADAIIRYSTLPTLVGQHRRDSRMFQYLSAHDVDEMVVDAPLPSPVRQGTIVIPVGRRLSRPDGRFQGLVVAVIRPEDFTDFFETASYGSGGFAWAAHPDGTLLLRAPSTKSWTGESAADQPMMLASAKEPVGVVRGQVDAGGPNYLTGYRRMTNPPVVVAISFLEADVLADWYQQRRTSTFTFAGLALTIAIFVALLFQQMDALGAAAERERTAREQAEVAGRLKDEFLMTLSHELRTPLNAILGWLHMIRGGTVDPARHEQAIATIERNAQAQARLVDDLLDVSRAVSGKLHIEARPTDVAETARAAAETLRPAMLARRIRFEENIEAGLGSILADPDRLQQIVWNLLSNAIKFTPEEGTVRLRVARAGAQVEIAVTDSGIGIERAFLPFVFDRFRQADAGPRREHGGLGLGLAIVRHLVELHGGTVVAESEGRGRGATFRVRLPAVSASAALP